MALLTKDQILAVDDLPREEVEVEEWGGSLLVRTMTAMEKSEYQAELMEMGKDNKSYKLKLEGADVRLASKCMCNPDGSRMFSRDEVAALGAKSSKALNRVVEACQRLNAITADEIEELVGKSEPTPNSDSATSSRKR